MGLLGSLLKTAINVATLPVSIIKDVVTVGGTLTDKEKPYTEERSEKISESLRQLDREIDNL